MYFRVFFFRSWFRQSWYNSKARTMNTPPFISMRSERFLSKDTNRNMITGNLKTNLSESMGRTIEALQSQWITQLSSSAFPILAAIPKPNAQQHRQQIPHVNWMSVQMQIARHQVLMGSPFQNLWKRFVAMHT